MVQKLLRGGERKERDGETEERSCCSLHRKTQLGQTARSVVVAAWGGEERREDGKGGRVNTTRTWQRQATGLLCFFMFGRGDRHYVSTSAHCCCNRRPSAAASEGETLGSLFNSWGPKAVHDHPFR